MTTETGTSNYEGSAVESTLTSASARIAAWPAGRAIHDVGSALDRLEDARQRWWVYSLLCNVVLVVVVSLGTLVLLIMADVGLQLPQLWLWLLLVFWLVFSSSLLIGTAYRVLRYQRTTEAAARRVELSFPELGSHLINLIQLTGSTRGDADGFSQAAIAEAAARLGNVRFHAVAEKESRWKRWKLGLQTPRDLIDFSAALALLVIAIIALNAAVPTWRSSADRLFTPWRFVPQVGAIQILEVTPGDHEVLVGSRVDIAAKIADPGTRKPRATLYVKFAGAEREVSHAMHPGETPDSFTFTFPAVAQAMQYRLQIGDSQSEIYHLGVRDRPAIIDVQVTYVYPAYLEMPELTVHQQHADLEAPQYTVAHVKLTCATPVQRGYLQFPERQIVGRVDEGGLVLRLEVPLTEPTTYTIHLFNELGHTDAEPRVNSVRVAVDAPPVVQIVKPAKETMAAVGDEVPLVVRASDDRGLDEVRLEWKVARAEEEVDETAAEPPQTLQQWPRLAGVPATTLAHRMVVDPARFAAEQTILVRAVAVDRRSVTFGNTRLEPQESASSWVRVKLTSPDQRAADNLAHLESVNAKLWAILQLQLRAKISTVQLKQLEDLAAALKQTVEIAPRQIQVQTSAVELATSIDTSQGDNLATVKQVLTRLAHGDMLDAARQVDLLAQSSTLDEVSAQAAPLLATQDRIIQTLRTLLEVTRRAATEALAEIKERAGGDLPSDVEEKLMALSDKLQEFIKQQKRVIEATENLAKKPVEDFTEEEKQLLQELAAAEDEWSRFMEETHSDFSKLPEQDFSNPSMLQEFVEVQTELKMAAGALTKKSADIAVPLEQLGAEMAEELVTNIEKWLPDTPDRERWSQEEPLTDAMKEAPMAELPGELEDLVGELMEEEEDLFDEMEDAGSSWADSLDKGAGWDAADGPISNMSAKGVTGNRLPNTSEIGGRSGEGRQGKASGEFVGDTAVGKGGRKTPSRLAPDPFVKGQVKDVSKDPVGGATGGGKESGVGGEGLEGPVPAQAQRELDRLANKQADLRNRAESVDVKFQVTAYHHTDLKRMIEMMRSVESDLRSGRYQSALRRRDVMLDGLGNIKAYVDGEFEVRRDQTSNLPEDIQKELLGSMSEASPAGWEALNRQYFERLSAAEQPPNSTNPPDPPDEPAEK